MNFFKRTINFKNSVGRVSRHTFRPWTAAVHLRLGTDCKIGGSASDSVEDHLYPCHILEHEENEMMRPYDVVG